MTIVVKYKTNHKPFRDTARSIARRFHITKINCPDGGVCFSFEDSQSASGFEKFLAGRNRAITSTGKPITSSVLMALVP